VNLEPKRSSWVDPKKLRELATAAGVRDKAALEAACRDLEEGADIGCRGGCRNGSFSGNAPSAYEYGAEVTDAIAGWVKKGIVAGPFSPEKRPQGVKINGIMCRPKPNGTARVIMNLSAPAGRSVNDGITTEEFPATMGSTTQWLGILRKAGIGAVIMKIDWAEAYKHVGVRDEDTKLQWFSWLGKDFYELRLVFGGASSCGIYDRLAKLVLEIALKNAGFPASMVCQYLDDLCAAASKDERERLLNFFDTYGKVAQHLGVKLAPTDDPEKAFLPTTRGTVLGVTYDTEKWTWEIPSEKLGRLTEQIRQALSADYLKQEEVWSLTGRLLHYMPLIPTGRFNLDKILAANGASEDKGALVELSAELKQQLWFWLSILKATAGACRIPVDLVPVRWDKEFFTDAAGGTMESPGRGSGGLAKGFWYYLPWPIRINCGAAVVRGKKVGRKLSALELVGPLVCVAAGFQLCKNKNVKIWVDNMGSVLIWKKGYSTTCPLSNTLVKAIATVAAGGACRVEIEKTRRRETEGAALADDISKGQLQGATGNREWGLSPAPAEIPRAILKWIEDPKEDDQLGAKILREIATSTEVLGY